MKILSEGIWNNPWALKCVCGNVSCKAEVLLDENDVKPTHDTDKFHFVCPVCETPNAVPADSIAPRVRQKVNKSRKSRKWSDYYD